ncbi:MAG: polyprenyl synthetase family protein [Firmicutes bacterium]|nr:polyprenyl synthetase family protein [Bacillota bacterium]
MRGISFFETIQEELVRVEEAIRGTLRADGESLASRICIHLQEAGGKRLRPGLTLLAAQFGPKGPSDQLYRVAAAVEITHMATLVHDDTIDEAETRRGIPTINARWDDGTAILAGDMLFAKAVSLLASVGQPRLLWIMADAIGAMCQGEIQQLDRRNDLNQEEIHYLERVEKKTAVFIAAACQMGALVSGADEETGLRLRGYGLNVGMAFQIIDDLLDLVQASDSHSGKPVGLDLKKGVFTLPLIYALNDNGKGDFFRTQLQKGCLNHAELLLWACEHLESTGALDRSRRLATAYITKARDELLHLPESPVRQVLDEIADFVQERSF